MSMQLNIIPASAGAGAGDVSSAANGIADVFHRGVGAVRAWLDLRRQLGEIEALSDRELSDIGLGQDEIHRLRRGDVFSPVGWSKHDTERDSLPV